MLQTNIEVFLDQLELTPLEDLEKEIKETLFNEEIFLQSEIDSVVSAIETEFNILLSVDKSACTVKLNLDKLANLAQEADMTNLNNENINSFDDVEESQETTIGVNVTFNKQSYIETLKGSYTQEHLTSVLEAWLKDNPGYTPDVVECVFTATADVLIKLETESKDAAESFNDYLAESVEDSDVEAATPASFSGKAVSNMKWVAAGAAVIGAGLESYANGEVTIGSGVGAAAGVTAAYFLTEKAVQLAKSENAYVNLTLGGVMGLGLGAAGSALGRMGGEYVSPSNDQDVSLDQPGEVYTSPLPTTGSDVTTEVVGL